MNVFEGWRITSPYGWRPDPFTGDKVWHTGIDLVKAHKSPIPAFIEGTCLYSGDGGGRKGYGAGYGNIVVLRDPFNHIHLYAHLDSVSVKAGQTIKRGQEVGKQGTTGRSTASHLHFEIRTSEVYLTDVDPTKYLINYFKREEVVIEMSKYFKDVEANRWSVKNIDSLYEKGIVKGKPDGTFDPTGVATREEVAKMVDEAINYVMSKMPIARI